jgi:hypothetical protein
MKAKRFVIAGMDAESVGFITTTIFVVVRINAQ